MNLANRSLMTMGTRPFSKLDSTAAAEAFSEASTYEVGDKVSYRGEVWECHTAITVGNEGPWTGSLNWTRVTLVDLMDGALVESVEYAALKSKRDLGLLVPGRLYRITDYETTTSGASNSQAANHRFDIIVQAVSHSKLSEQARAVMHEGDLPDDIVENGTRTKYFAACNLEAWKLEYCLDNDLTRFDWAESTGKGVIFHMIDEQDNEAYYDFKNMMFKRWAITEITSAVLNQTELSSLSEAFVAANPGDPLFAHRSDTISKTIYTLNVDSENYAYYYTFTVQENFTPTEATRYYPSISSSGLSGIARNMIGRVTANTANKKQKLNGIVVFCGGTESGNTFEANCECTTLGSGSRNNTFGAGSSRNYLGEDSIGNIFSAESQFNLCGNGCENNSVGYESSENVLGAGCLFNSLKDSSSSNYLGINAESNILGGGGCDMNMIGGESLCNSIGHGCHHIVFGNGVDGTKSYYHYITIDVGNHYLYLNCTNGSLSASNPYRFVTVCKGTNCENNTNYKTIADSTVGQTMLTVYKAAGSEEVEV